MRNLILICLLAGCAYYGYFVLQMNLSKGHYSFSCTNCDVRYMTARDIEEEKRACTVRPKPCYNDELLPLLKNEFFQLHANLDINP